MRRIINTESGPRYGDDYPISHGAETESLVLANGMAFDVEAGGRMAAAETIADETRIVLESIDEVLRDAGCTLSDVVKTTVYLTEREYYGEMNSVYRQYWPSGDYPTRATLYVGLGADCRVEIDATAVKQEVAR